MSEAPAPRPADELPPRANILVVDDSREKLLALGAILAELDQNVVEAQSGREALRELLRRDFAVVLLDVNMPGMDGFETASLVRQRKSSEHTPIIFITAYSDDTHARQGYELGAVDYIITPVIPEVLKSKVGFFVDLYRKSAQIRRQAESLSRRAAHLQRLTRASLAINSAPSIEEILGIVTATAREIAGADRAEIVPSITEPWAAAASALPGAPARPGSDPANVAATLMGRDGRDMGTLRIFGNSPGPDEEAILTQLAQMASIAIENVMYSEAREANRLKDEFLTTLSHELRTPLTAILGWTRILRAPALDPGRFSHGLDVIERNVNAQAKLIDDLLDISRISAAKLRLNTRPMAVVPVVEGVVDGLRPSWEAKSLDVRVVVEPSAGRSEIAGDADRIQQVVWNLLSNAIKFTPTSGSIEVGVDRTPAHVRIRVTDSGKGISPDFLGHVFDRFRQADSSTTRTHGGLGIGLAIVRHLVEMHGGSVSASSPGPGKGATFVVSLPALETAASDARVPASGPRRAAPPPDLPGLRVAVVDDEPDTREIIAEILKSAGVTVAVYAGMEEALDGLSRTPADVLVSDIAMPGGDGYALLREVRRRESGTGRRLPAIALTALVRTEDRTRALDEGFDRHVSKPIEPEEFLRILAEVAPR
ncbi:MAG TPA: response regulator, partial [Thermoanaerobaculia bacterium]|nr:response regulator [Thermoanaerobaculia bacterium]